MSTKITKKNGFKLFDEPQQEADKIVSLNNESDIQPLDPIEKISQQVLDNATSLVNSINTLNNKIEELSNLYKDNLSVLSMLNTTIENIYAKLQQFDKQDIGTHQLRTTVL